MISHFDRRHAVELIDEAVTAGARQHKACASLELSARTYQRWTQDVAVLSDARPSAERPVPSNKLSVEERQVILAVSNSPTFRSLPPSQIVPILADEGRYLASESTFYRVLREAEQQHHRGRSKAPQHKPLEYPLCQRPQSGVVLGYHLAAGTGPWSVLLPLPGPGSLQSQDCGLGGS